MLSSPQGAGEPRKNLIPYFSVIDNKSYFSEVVKQGAKVERKPQLTEKCPITNSGSVSYAKH